MMDRNDIIAEQLLRENIRTAIKIVKGKREKEENILRGLVRSLLSEEVTVKYEYTSLNQLAHFIREVVGDPSKPDSNPAFKDAYTDLTSSHDDREMFVEYVLDFGEEDFKTIDADKEPKPLGQDFVEKGFLEDDDLGEEEPEQDEMVKISIEDLEDRGGDLTASPEEEEEEDVFTLGEDGEFVEMEEEGGNSGVKRFAREAYKRIGPSLRRYYLNVPKDTPLKKAVQIGNEEFEIGAISERDLFRIYFKKNMVLWAARYEEEFFDDTPENQVDIDDGDSEEEVFDVSV